MLFEELEHRVRGKPPDVPNRQPSSRLTSGVLLLNPPNQGSLPLTSHGRTDLSWKSGRNGSCRIHHCHSCLSSTNFEGPSDVTKRSCGGHRRQWIYRRTPDPRTAAMRSRPHSHRRCEAARRGVPRVPRCRRASGRFRPHRESPPAHNIQMEPVSRKYWPDQ